MATQTQLARTNIPRLPTILALTMFTIVGLSYSLNAMDRQVFSVLLPQIREEYSFSLSTGGLLSTVFGVGVGAGALVAGFLSDRYSRKWVMIVGIFVYSVFTIAIPLATGFVSMATYRILSGVGEGLQQAALYAAVGAYYSRRRATALGALNFGFGSGTVLGPVLGGLIFASTNSWELPFFIFGAVGFVFIAVIAAIVPRNFTEQAGDSTATPEQESGRSDLRELLNPHVVKILITAGTAGFSAFGWIAVYPTFVREELGFTTVQGANAIAAFGVGALLMGFLGGYLGDRCNPRIVIAASMTLSAVIAVMMFHFATTPLAVYVSAFGFGAMLSGFAFVNLYALAQKCVPNSMVGRVSGVFVFSYYCCVGFSGYLFGSLVQIGDWTLGVWVQLVAVPLAGALVILTLKKISFSEATS